MKNKLRMYVEALFDNAMKTEEVIELREEILQNVIDKYEDLVSSGKSEDEAYSTAVSGIGDINELLRTMGNSVTGDQKAAEDYKRDEEPQGKAKTHLLCAAVMLYILSLIPTIIGDEVIGGRAEGIGICIMFAICAVATVLLIMYVSSKPKDKNDKEAEENPVDKSINSAVGAVTTVLYLVISFATGAWYITWLIFPIASAISQVIKAYRDIKEYK